MKFSNKMSKLFISDHFPVWVIHRRSSSGFDLIFLVATVKMEHRRKLLWIIYLAQPFATSRSCKTYFKNWPVNLSNRKSTEWFKLKKWQRLSNFKIPDETTYLILQRLHVYKQMKEKHNVNIPFKAISISQYLLNCSRICHKMSVICAIHYCW